VAALVAAALLFGGRWAAALLTDRWWAEAVAPAAAPFLTQLHILRLVLDVTGVVLAAAWFIGHLLVVYRAIGSVQVPRHVANIEFREAVGPRTLLAGVIAGGGLLGLLVGSGVSRWWSTIALAWQAPSFGVREPLLGRDVGTYVTQLPLWRELHGFTLLLVLLALLVALTLYVLVGAVRWIEGRPAINDHARRHLGWLLAGLAGVLAWGYLLEPYERIAGLPGPVDAGTFGTVAFVSPALAGVALTATALSALWAMRPRHTLVLAGWVVLAGASVVGHYVAPVVTSNHPRLSPPTAARDLAQSAWGLVGLRESTMVASDSALQVDRVTLGLWHPAALSGGRDSLVPPIIDAAVLGIGARRQPAWLIVRGAAGGGATVAAVADDRVSAVGTPLYLREADSVAYPSPSDYDTLSPHATRPFAREQDVSDAARGPLAGGWVRRLLLAWALQSADVLTAPGASVRVAWRLSPESRLEALAPFIDWGAPSAAYVDRRLVWLTDGYIAARTFPTVDTLRWRGQLINSLRAGFVGVIDAETGVTRIFLRQTAGPVAEAWAALAQGVIEPADAMPPAVTAVLRYPSDLLAVQARALADADLSIGTPAGATDSARGVPWPPSLAWRPGAMPSLVIAFERPREGRLSAALEGRVAAGELEARLVRIDSAVGLAAPETLAARWHRFVTFEQLRDSVSAAGARVEPSAVRIWLGPRALGEYEVVYARRRSGAVSVAWVSVAAGPRLGAGHTPVEAWSNLRGASAPLPPGATRSQLEEARRWLGRADSALRRGDLTAFGRAFEALKAILQAPADSTR
jgi:hypothetical protein